MKAYVRLIVLMGCVWASLCMVSCTEKKQAELVVSEQEFILRQDSDHSFVIDAKGKVRNIGQVDVKKVVVTGYCRSCGEVLVNGKWCVNDPTVERTPEQKDIISYIAVGAEAEFEFRDIAFLMDQAGKKPEKLPDGLEVKILSFEPVND